MKFLVAGYGSIGRRHLRNLLALGEQDVTVFRTRHGTLPEEELAGIAVETDLQKALAARPDGVVISNPTALHLDVAIPAAKAGCHILMEKPISHSLERVDELKAALQRGGGKLLMGFQFRFHPGLQKVDQLLKDGAIGRVVSSHAQWGEYLPGWHPWEDYRRSYAARTDLGGGVVLTLCHPLDYLRWLQGEITDLWAMTANFGDLQIPVEEAAEIGLRFASGALGSVHLNYYQRPGRHFLEVIGTQGTILWDNAYGLVRLFHPATETWETFNVPEGFDRNWLFMAEMRHFLAVVSGAVQPVCTLQDGVQALRLVTGVYDSNRTGTRSVISMEPQV